MTTPKPYQYRGAGRVQRDRVGARLDRRNPNKEVLTGEINGIKASDLEERYARALHKMEMPFEFRFRITSPLLGKQRLTQQFLNEAGEVEIDFLVEKYGVITPVFIDGNIGHFYTDYQADKDAIKTNVTNEFGQGMGWRPAVRVPFWKLQDQDMTDRTVREMFSGEFVSTTDGVVTVNGGAITNDGSGYIWKTPGRVIEEVTNTRIMRKEKYEEARGFL